MVRRMFNTILLSSKDISLNLFRDGAHLRFKDVHSDWLPLAGTQRLQHASAVMKKAMHLSRTQGHPGSTVKGQQS